METEPHPQPKQSLSKSHTHTLFSTCVCAGHVQTKQIHPELKYDCRNSQKQTANTESDGGASALATAVFEFSVKEKKKADSFGKASKTRLKVSLKAQSDILQGTLFEEKH